MIAGRENGSQPDRDYLLVDTLLRRPFPYYREGVDINEFGANGNDDLEGFENDRRAIVEPIPFTFRYYGQEVASN